MSWGFPHHGSVGTPVWARNRQVRADACKYAHSAVSKSLKVELKTKEAGSSIYQQVSPTWRRSYGCRETTVAPRALRVSCDRKARFLERDCHLPETRRKYRAAMGEGRFTCPSPYA